MAQPTSKNNSKASAYLEEIARKAAPRRSHSDRSVSTEDHSAHRLDRRTTGSLRSNRSVDRSFGCHDKDTPMRPSSDTTFGSPGKQGRPSSVEQTSSTELQTSQYGKVYDKSWGGFSNLAYLDPSDEEEGEAIESTVVDTMRNIKLGAETIQDWVDYQREIEENCSAVRKQIEEKRHLLIEMVDTHAQRLHDELDSISSAYTSNSERAISDVDEVLQKMQQLMEDRVSGALDTMDSVLKTKHTLGKLNQDFEACDSEPPEWKPIELQSVEHSPKLITRLLGSLQGGPQSLGWASDLEKGAPQPQVLKSPVKKGDFTVKSAKDQRECGVVDIAITDDKRLLVVDKHNRLVKIFDTMGNPEGYLGKNQLKEPSRVLVLANTGNILVTDNCTKSIKLFHKGGEFVSDFVSELKQPAGLCQMPDGNIAVVEFVTKSVMVYDQGGKQLLVFPTECACPAFISSTRDGNIVVSDWKLHVFTIFDLTGCALRQVNGEGSTEGQLSTTFKEPQGVCGDVHGHIAIADKRNHRVVIYGEDGDFQYSYGGPDCQFKLPMAVSCNRYGLLAVAEYQGRIKLLQYLDMDSPLPSQSQSNCKRPSRHRRYENSLVVPDDVKLENKHESETVC